ncbi:hypothetical protein HNP40_002147 [Mycobacteroides chelonae]|nr:hypothetical protein [Mycobacteroides chelonae]
MMFVLVRRAALLVAGTVAVGVPLALGVSHADPPCAPGAAHCALPTAVVPPAGGHEKCVEPKPGEQVCTEPGDAELHSTPTAHIPAPPLTVAPTKPAPTVHWS